MIRSFRRTATLLTLALFAPGALAVRPGGDEARHLKPLAPEVLAADKDAFRQHNMTLANPFFEGRAPGTRGNALAADYLDWQFKRLDLKPAFPTQKTGDDGNAVDVPRQTFRQTFQHGKKIEVTRAEASWKAGQAAADLKAGTDFNVLSYSGDGDVTAPLVFAGYAIGAGTDGYSSFPEKTDLTGKIAVVFRFEPMKEDGSSLWVEKNWSYLAALEPKVGQCMKRGAVGVILVNPPGAKDDRVARLETVDSLESRTGAGKVPVIMVTTEAAAEMVKAGDTQGRSLLDLRKIVDKAGEIIDLPNTTVTIGAGVNRLPINTDNVGAILPGRGALADEYVVIGAHYDHVGYGAFGSLDENGKGKIHPGADDNASGTSGMLVLASKLSAAYAALPPGASTRSVLFLGFSAEESGLIGSRHYTVGHMIADKSKHYIMLNLDMIGRLTDNKIEIHGVGTADGLEEWAQPYFDSSGLTVAKKGGGSGPSDHASFNAAEIPVLFFFTGTHAQYHKTTDTADLINSDGAARIIDMVYRIAIDAAARTEPFTYRVEQRLKQDQAPTEQPAPRMSISVRFGVSPEYAEDKPGVLFGDVAEGWSAGKAGLKKGDRMIKWNGQDVTSVEGWMPFLAAAKPGDKVKIVVIRDDKEQEFEVTLMGRDNNPK